MQPGAELNLRINAVFPPSIQGATSPPLPIGNQILATVTGTGPGGQLILKAGDVSLFVRQPVNAPIGSQLLLTIDPAQTDNPPALLTLADRLIFSNLQQIFEALAQIDPDAARALLANRMPH